MSGSEEEHQNTDERQWHHMLPQLTQKEQALHPVHHKVDAYGNYWSYAAYTKLRRVDDGKGTLKNSDI